MAQGVSIDAALFASRVTQLVAVWKWPLDAMILVSGKQTDDAEEHKTMAMHYWLLGIGFPETAITLLRSGRTIFYASAKKLEHLRHLEGPEVVLLPKSGSDADGAHLKTLVNEIKASKPKVLVGMLQKEKHIGASAEAFLTAVHAMQGVDLTECRDEISTLLAPKQEVELELVKKAAVLAVLCMNETFRPKFEDLIETDAKISNRSLSNSVDEDIMAEDTLNKWQRKHGLDPSEIDLTFSSLQSGRQFELKPAVESSEELVPMQGTFLLSLGVKYAEYSACLTRTIFINPTDTHKKIYSLLLEVQQLVVEKLRPAESFRDIYLAARGLLQQKMPSFADKFTKSVGFVTGLEFNDLRLQLNEKSDRTVVAGMVFCVSVGVNETNVPQWASWVTDTVIVPLGGTECEVSTKECSTRLSDVMFELDPDEPPPPPPAPVKKAPPAVPAERRQSTPKQSTPKRAAAASDSRPRKGRQPAAAKAPPERPTRTSGRKSTPQKAETTKAVDRQKREQRPARNFQGVNATGPRGTRTRARIEQVNQAIAERNKIEERQLDLRRKKLAELRERLCSTPAGNGATCDASGSGFGGQAGARLHECFAYGGPQKLPDARPHRLQLDPTAEALLVPAFGCLLPFHARTIRNMARSTVEGKELLRVNFFVPGQGKTVDDFPRASGNRIHVRELSFASASKENFDSIYRNFKELQKRMRQNEIENQVRRRSSAVAGGTGQQETLDVSRSGFPCLRDLSMRPNFSTSSRRTLGNLEGHRNGLRFIKRGSQEKIDLLYSQIKHAICEPCEYGSQLTLIHIHLKEPIMVGKRKTQDLQFFTEVGPQTEDLSMSRVSNAHDPDEILEEEREREMKLKINQMFQDFCKKVEAIETCPLEFDMPWEALSFNGVPHRAVVRLKPCKQALVALQEWPPFCLSLSDVDIVVFERAIMSLREFDVAFVHKDYEQAPVRVTTVPMSELDKIKAWLSQINAVWYACSMNMQWQMVLKEITRDYKEFLDNGGWDQWFAGAAQDSEESSGDDGAGSDYKVSDDDPSEEDNDEDAGDESAFEPDADDSEDVDVSEADDEEGMDWDELEEEAERADRKRDTSTGGGSKTAQPPAKRGRTRK